VKRRVFIVTVVILLLTATGAFVWVNWPTPPRTIPTKPAADAPTVGTCWQVDELTAMQIMPWKTTVVDCASQHTAEMFYVGQVGADLLHRYDKAKDDDNGQEAQIVTNLLYAQARRACLIQASVFLGGGWHEARLTVLASWIKPASDGFYGCALAEVDGPAAEHFVHRQGSLKNALLTDNAPLHIDCVNRGAGDDTTNALTYIPCDKPHDGEFVGTYTITPLDAPFDANAVRNTAQRGCSEAAAKYLGITNTIGRKDLDAGSVGPKTAIDWLGSDQTFACYAMAADGKIVGTVHNLGMLPLTRKNS
jgi:hypothetical protein